VSGQLRGRHQLPHQTGCGQHHQQKAQPFQRAQGQQVGRGLGCHAAEAGHRQQAQPRQQAAAQAPGIGRQAQQRTAQHARRLHHRQQKTRLHQRHIQCVAQRRQGRWHLANVQGRHHAAQNGQQGRGRNRCGLGRDVGAHVWR